MKVSICIITYGHQDYIIQTIESVLMQECDFEIELIIANDCSPDNTDKIVRDFVETHPKGQMVLYTKHPKNLGMMPNFIWALNQCKGKYIALCEGDDYWTDPLKLQKQIDFLEANPSYSICFHEVELYNQQFNRLEPDTITREVEVTTTINDLAKGNYIHTPSVVFLNNFSIPKWFKKLPIGDYPLYCLLAKSSNIFKINEVMGVYRVHNEGVMHLYKKEKYYKSTRHHEKYINLYYQLWLEFKITSFKNDAVSRYKSFRKTIILNNEPNKARNLAFLILLKYNKLLNRKQILIAFITMFLPSLVKKHL